MKSQRKEKSLNGTRRNCQKIHASSYNSWERTQRFQDQRALSVTAGGNRLSQYRLMAFKIVSLIAGLAALEELLSANAEFFLPKKLIGLKSWSVSYHIHRSNAVDMSLRFSLQFLYLSIIFVKLHFRRGLKIYI